MLFIRRSKNVRKRQSAWLYSAVFNGALSTCLIFILFASFLIQPFHKALAAEPSEVSEEAPAVAEDVKVQEELVEPEPEPQPTPETTETTEMTGEEAIEEGPDTEIEEVSDVVPDVTEEDIDTELPAEGDTDAEPDGGDTDGSDMEAGSEENAEEEEAHKNKKPEQVVQVEGLVTEENFYQFSKQSCVEVGGGTYHCTTSTEGVTDAQSIAYAERDGGGDMEIFVRTSKNRVKQLTDNDYDDTSPHYDPESMRVVWQRLVDGRQQILLYDIMEEKESQLTFSRTNNMEPKVSNDGIVWQAWDEHDWEIMYFDGTYTEQLTENESQDVAPVIEDGYVLWNVLGGDEQQARLYDLDTKETISIEGHEGGTISNPRFVLVYDTEYENGDVVTQSLDPATGLSEPVAARPAPEPINIPESDPVGEIRALITSGKSKDEKQLLDIDTDIDSGDGNASSTDSNALNLKQADDSVSAPVTIDMSDNFELTEYDLVIPEGAFEQALEEMASSTQQ
ncbi:MAG: hypothetical protein RL538_206 [Candidatus Parcubacteria bacterium]|jgi:hypothetical protein